MQLNRVFKLFINNSKQQNMAFVFKQQFLNYTWNSRQATALTSNGCRFNTIDKSFEQAKTLIYWSQLPVNKLHDQMRMEKDNEKTTLAVNYSSLSVGWG